MNTIQFAIFCYVIVGSLVGGTFFKMCERDGLAQSISCLLGIVAMITWPLFAISMVFALFNSD